MRKQEHHRIDERIDEQSERPSEAPPRVRSSWTELGEESTRLSFAEGTWPGVLIDESGDPPTDPTPPLRTRITFVGQITATRDVSACAPALAFTSTDDDAPADGKGLMRASRLPSAADRMQLWRVMTPRVVCVRSNVSTDALLAILVDLDLRAVPVVDAVGRPVGIVSRSDLLRHADGSGPDRSAEQVADVMMSLAFSLPETASLSRAAAVMAYEGVHRIPVVAGDGKVVGIISSLDVVRWLARHDGYLVPDGGAGE
jgi:CBS domain-containing protein